MSATSTTSSSASSSQLSPTTPPAHLPISTSHVPKSGREDDEDVHVNGEGSDWGSADAEQPLYVNAADVDDALGNMDPRVGQRDNPRHAHSDRHLVPGRGSSAQQRQRQDGQLGSSVSAPSTLGATSTAASVFTRPDSPKRNGALRASASASAETELSVWDNSLHIPPFLLLPILRLNPIISTPHHRTSFLIHLWLVLPCNMNPCGRRLALPQKFLLLHPEQRSAIGDRRRSIPRRLTSQLAPPLGRIRDGVCRT
ncbi:hypothetical protein DL93DRAFT_2084469, partial [Clavulina sp. PMI_390]